MGKVVDRQEFKEKIRPELKKKGKTVALCHGVFDLVHPGHILHLEQAKKMADVLVVSVTAARFVRKGPGRPYFNDEMRMKFLAAIGCVDYVMLSEGYTGEDIIENVEPDIYVKGAEYAEESKDVTGKISEERKLVERHGGKLRFTSGEIYSSTKLINTAMSGLPDEVIQFVVGFKKKYSMHDIMKYTDKAEKLKILVVGDVIIDKYTYCRMQGLMSKDMGYSTSVDFSESYFGGAAAVARHLGSFSKNVTLMSIIGDEGKVRARIFDELADKINFRLTYSKMSPTIIKHRYLTKNSKREEYRKIFAVNNISSPMEYENSAKDSFISNLREALDEYDAVFLCDFGHGLVDKEVKDYIQGKAKYLVLNCQTNSTNYGMNIITKYRRADAFTLNQKELKLAYPDLSLKERGALQKLSRHLGGNGWLTRGSSGAYGIEQEKIHDCPAFTLIVKDTVGAGDAFYSVAGLYTAAGAPALIGTFMGNIAGALEANTVGNKDSVEKVNALKYAGTLMNI